jgi:alkanesulfonate monooxygenase SsuD/methylene tetrahydromethanopterin reductase-like flavin-dependent oxidoreductase (luciferase family)
MHVGLMMAIRNLPERPLPLATLYEEYIGDAVYAEELGFDGVWIGEHHFTADQIAPSQFIVLTAIAQRTTTLRLGAYVLVAPLHHPLRAAEDAAMVDILSGGRLELGVGVGSSLREYLQFGVPIEGRHERMFEAVEVMRKCFSGQRFSHDGKYFRFDDIENLTVPIQRPHPRIWVGAHGPKAVAMTARAGFHLASPMRDSYDQALLDCGRDPAGYEAIMLRFIHLADTRDRAWDQAQEGLHHALRFVRANREWDRTQLGFDGMSQHVPGMEQDALPPMEELRNLPGLGLGGAFIVGTPDDALDALSPIVSDGRMNLGFHFHHPGMAVEDVRRSMRLFAAEVMPVLRSSPGSNVVRPSEQPVGAEGQQRVQRQGDQGDRDDRDVHRG